MVLQQGDVILTAVSSVPESARRVAAKSGKLVLAEGESTGHAHAVAEAEAVLVEKDGVLYLSVPGNGATVTHEEHGAIVVPKGDYKVSRVVEYDHFAEEAKQVRD